ncbi:MAG: hypothetical protein WC444_06660 [Candidatus Paceibacterota bacterium]
MFNFPNTTSLLARRNELFKIADDSSQTPERREAARKEADKLTEQAMTQAREQAMKEPVEPLTQKPTEPKSVRGSKITHIQCAKCGAMKPIYVDRLNKNPSKYVNWKCSKCR